MDYFSIVCDGQPEHFWIIVNRERDQSPTPCHTYEEACKEAYKMCERWDNYNNEDADFDIQYQIYRCDLYKTFTFKSRYNKEEDYQENIVETQKPNKSPTYIDMNTNEKFKLNTNNEKQMKSLKYQKH